MVQGLWDSWDDDAFVRERESGQLFRPGQTAYARPQGPVLPGGRSAQYRTFAARAAGDLSGGLVGFGHCARGQICGRGVHAFAVSRRDQSVYRQVRKSAVEHGRAATDVKIFPGIGPIVGATLEEAEAKYRAIRDLLTIDDALAYLGRFFEHHDFTQYPLDEPFPELGDLGANSFRSTTDRIKAEAKRSGRRRCAQVALEVATPKTAVHRHRRTDRRRTDPLVRRRRGRWLHPRLPGAGRRARRFRSIRDSGAGGTRTL